MPVGPPSAQVPSAPYDVQTYSAANIVYVELKGSKFLTITGAKAFCRIDYAQYDSTVYRDTIDASKLGRASTGIVKIEDSTFTTVDYPGLNAASSVAYGGDFVMEILDNTVAAPFLDQTATMMMLDDEVTHTAPRMQLSPRTLMLWFDNITPGTPPTIPTTANVVGKCWADRYEGECNGAIPQTNGSVPPTFTIPTP